MVPAPALEYTENVDAAVRRFALGYVLDAVRNVTGAERELRRGGDRRWAELAKMRAALEGLVTELTTAESARGGVGRDASENINEEEGSVRMR